MCEGGSHTLVVFRIGGGQLVRQFLNIGKRLGARNARFETPYQRVKSSGSIRPPRTITRLVKNCRLCRERIPQIWDVTKNRPGKILRGDTNDCERNVIYSKYLPDDSTIASEPFPVGITQDYRRGNLIVVTHRKPPTKEEPNPKCRKVTVGHRVDQAIFLPVFKNDSYLGNGVRNRAELGKDAVVVSKIEVIGI